MYESHDWLGKCQTVKPCTPFSHEYFRLKEFKTKYRDCTALKKKSPAMFELECCR